MADGRAPTSNVQTMCFDLKPHVLPTTSLSFSRYGFLLRVKSMGMGSAIDRERKIATYWARLIDEADAYDENGGGHDTD